MKKYPNIRTLIFYFFSMFFLAIFLIDIVEISILKFNPTIEKDLLDVLVESILQLSIYFIIFIGIILLMKDFYKDEYSNFKLAKGRYFVTAIIGWLATYAILFVYGLLLLLFKYESGVPENQQAIEQIFFNYPYLVIPVLIIGAPFIEETIFRGIIFRTIHNQKWPYKLNLITAFIVSSGIFGFVHVLMAYLPERDITAIIDGIPYFISGFALTFVYYKSKNIYVPMITHFLHNSTATFFMFLSYLLKDFLPEEVTSSTIALVLKLLHLQ